MLYKQWLSHLMWEVIIIRDLYEEIKIRMN